MILSTKIQFGILYNFILNLGPEEMTCNNIVFEQLTIQAMKGLTNHGTIDVEACTDFCNAQPNCMSFVFDFSIRECHTSALTPQEYSQYSRYMGGPRGCKWQWNDCVRLF
jgi:hypothetical protein